MTLFYSPISKKVITDKILVQVNWQNILRILLSDCVLLRGKDGSPEKRIYNYVGGRAPLSLRRKHDL